MRGVRYSAFGGPIEVIELHEPEPPEHGAVIRVEAAGVCRSDWHGWLGHDPDITLPHVPGHEFAGTVHAVGSRVDNWRGGERVTAPFVCGCGACRMCLRGDHQVCERQTQPGFTHHGSFGEFVVVHHADVNLVALPDAVEAVAAAALGCRFATAYRAVIQQGRLRPGMWVAVHGCGGVGLSAVMIAAAAGARVIAVDVSADALELATDLGAEACVDAAAIGEDAARLGAAVRHITGGGTDLSLDTVGTLVTSAASVHSVARRGRHVQVGLLPPQLGTPALPMDRVIGHELEIVGSHGMAAHAYPAMLSAVSSGRLRPDRLVTTRVDLEAVPDVLTAMSTPGGTGAGITVAVL